MRPALVNKLVLSVDDSRAIRAFVASLLGNAGAQVDEVGNGADAIKRVASNDRRYDLVLLDLVLPDIDGLEVLRRIRKQDTDSTIVVLTGAGGVASATSAMQHGADGYVEKQYLTKIGGEPEFFYALQQAMEHRAGYVARRQLDQLRTDFYSMVTHDLRNPAGSVLGFIKLLLAHKAGPLQPRQEELLRMAQRSAEKLVSQITTYLDYSKIEAGYLRLSPSDTDLAAVVRESSVQAEILAGAKGQTIALDIPHGSIMGYLDGDKLEHVFDNLIANAIKYTPEQGLITIVLRQEGDEAIFSISDTGHGIPKEQLEAIFTKYHRVPTTDRNTEGSGLGLLIVKEIVQAHHGFITVESEGISGQGSTFTIRLPLHALLTTHPPATATSSGVAAHGVNDTMTQQSA